MNPSYNQGYESGRIFGLFIAALIAAWVIADAVKRGRSPVEAIAYGLFTFCCCIIGLPVYLIVRSSQTKTGGY